MSQPSEPDPGLTAVPEPVSVHNPDMRNVVEAALFASPEPLTLDRLALLFPDEARPARDELRKVIEAIGAEYDGRGIELRRVDRGWRFQTRGQYSDWIQRLAEERPVRYSRALLETLAIIAYRQPVTRAEIEDIRGVAVSTEIIRTLIGRDWVKQVGVRDVPGRPALYGTNRGFLEHFSLRSLSDLPPLSELRDIASFNEQLPLEMVEEDPPESSSSDASPQPMNPEQESQSCGTTCEEPAEQLPETEPETVV